MRDSYEAGQRIQHATFGRGIVDRLLEGKMIVLFVERGEITLAFGRG